MNVTTDEYLPARRVWERYGVTQMTLWRWLQDDQMSFPKPTYIGRKRYWRTEELVKWEREQPSKPRPPRSSQTALPDNRVETPDGVVRCLYHITQPTGSKSYSFRYRVGERTVKYTIGVADADSHHRRSVPVVSLREARLIASALNNLVDRFSAPQIEDAPTLESVE